MSPLDPIYDLTILVSVGLATIVGAVYAVATTFLGRALDKVKQEISEEASKARADSERLIAQLTQKLAAPGDESIADIKKLLDEAEGEGKKRSRDRWRKRLYTGPHLLSVLHTVVIPGSLFLLAAVLSALAKIGSAEEIAGDIWWWIGGVVAFTVGMGRLVLVLRAIETIGSTSDAAYLASQITAFNEALKQREEESRPDFYWRPQEGEPIEFLSGKKSTITFRLSLAQGSIAHNVDVLFWIPTSFEYGAGHNPTTSEAGNFPGWHRTYAITDYTIRSGYFNDASIEIEAPTEAGDYEFGYIIISDEFSTDAETLAVKVNASPKEASK